MVDFDHYWTAQFSAEVSRTFADHALTAFGGPGCDGEAFSSVEFCGFQHVM